MKTRSGFVSNSSTTSFSIYGYNIHFSNKEERQLLKEAVLKYLAPNDYQNLLSIELFDDTDMLRALTKRCFPDMEIMFGENEDFMYIGRDKLHNRYSGGEPEHVLEQKVSEKIKSVFGNNAHCFDHEEEWYDG